MKRPRRCGACGTTEIMALKKSHEIDLPWKDYPSVRIEGGVDGFRCKGCGEMSFSAAQGDELDVLIKVSITQQVKKFIGDILAREGCEQREIAAHLGVSPEYLSEIKSGRKIPKFQTFNFLKTLAFDRKSFKVSSPSFHGVKTG